MKTLHTKSRTSPSGELCISLPVGMPSTDVDVVLIVQEIQTNGLAGANGPVTDSVGSPYRASAATGDVRDWTTLLDHVGGAWEGEFVRPPAGEFERRVFEEFDGGAGQGWPKTDGSGPANTNTDAGPRG